MLYSVSLPESLADLNMGEDGRKIPLSPPCGAIVILVDG